jgi:hypothetical protein
LEQRELLARLRAVVEAKDAEISLLRAELAAERELRKRLGLQIAGLQRRLGMDSTDSGTPTSGESIGARERRKAKHRNRQQSERERSKDRRRGGQPGHPGSGLRRDPDPDERKTADPPASRPLAHPRRGSGRQRDCLFSEAVDQVFRPKASGSLKSERGWLRRANLL